MYVIYVMTYNSPVIREGYTILLEHFIVIIYAIEVITT